MSISTAHWVGNSSPWKIMILICTSSIGDLLQQSGLTHHHHLTYPHDHLNPSNLSMSYKPDYKWVRNIPQFDENIQMQPPELKIFPDGSSPVNDTLQVLPFEHSDCEPLGPFATPQQWQLGHLIADINPSKVKLDDTHRWEVLYLMPMPKTLTSSFNSMWTWMNWMNLYGDGKRVLSILKAKLL